MYLYIAVEGSDDTAGMVGVEVEAVGSEVVFVHLREWLLEFGEAAFLRFGREVDLVEETYKVVPYEEGWADDKR